VDREEIERQDFPAARRGYDASAVQQHLRRVADEFEALARRPAPGSLAEGASTRVQAIIEAAETSAQQLREDAGREATAHVERVGEAARELLADIERAQADLDRLLGAIKQNAGRLATSLDELARHARAIRAPAAEAPASNGARSEDEAGARSDDEAGARSEDEAGTRADDEAGARSDDEAGARSDDEAGARLVALHMALEGTPRDETLRYLADHYELPDLDALLDDVYASAGR
jgi:DivIVA domain-containing protein